MKDNIRLVKALVKLRFERVMMFRLGFFGPFFVDGSQLYTGKNQDRGD